AIQSALRSTPCCCVQSFKSSQRSPSAASRRAKAGSANGKFADAAKYVRTKPTMAKAIHCETELKKSAHAENTNARGRTRDASAAKIRPTAKGMNTAFHA